VVSSFFFSSPNLSRRRLDVCHTSTHDVALAWIYDAGLKHAVRGSLKIQDAKSRLLGTIAQLCWAISSQLRHILIIGKKLVKQQYLLHMSSQYGELRLTRAEIVSSVWGTQANFNGFRVLSSLLQPRHSTEANQTLHDVWPSPGLVHYIYIFGGSCPVTEFCQVQHSLSVQVLRSLFWQRYCTALQEWASAKLCGVNRGRTYIRQGGHHVGHWPTF